MYDAMGEIDPLDFPVYARTKPILPSLLARRRHTYVRLYGVELVADETRWFIFRLPLRWLILLSFVRIPTTIIAALTGRSFVSILLNSLAPIIPIHLMP